MNDNFPSNSIKAIFVWKVEPDHRDEFFDRWYRGSELLQQCDGAQGTELHEAHDDPNVFMAIASWDSKAHRDRAVAKCNRESPGLISSHDQISELLFTEIVHAPHVRVMPSDFGLGQ